MHPAVSGASGVLRRKTPLRNWKTPWELPSTRKSRNAFSSTMVRQKHRMTKALPTSCRGTTVSCRQKSLADCTKKPTTSSKCTTIRAWSATGGTPCGCPLRKARVPTSYSWTTDQRRTGKLATSTTRTVPASDGQTWQPSSLTWSTVFLGQAAIGTSSPTSLEDSSPGGQSCDRHHAPHRVHAIGSQGRSGLNRAARRRVTRSNPSAAHKCRRTPNVPSRVRMNVDRQGRTEDGCPALCCLSLWGWQRADEGGLHHCRDRPRQSAGATRSTCPATPHAQGSTPSSFTHRCWGMSPPGPHNLPRLGTWWFCWRSTASPTLSRSSGAASFVRRARRPYPRRGPAASASGHRTGRPFRPRHQTRRGLTGVQSPPGEGGGLVRRGKRCDGGAGRLLSMKIR